MGSRTTPGWFVTIGVPKNIGAHRGLTAVATALGHERTQYIGG